MKVLLINYDGMTPYFPMRLDLYRVKTQFKCINDDVLGVKVPQGDDYWLELNDEIRASKPVTTIVIDKMAYEFIEKGKQFIKDNTAEFDSVNCDYETCAATWCHQSVLQMTGADCIYDLCW
jgi:hypothetical protein